jgi:predicted ATPase/class 3 adenylate cyclase
MVLVGYLFTDIVGSVEKGERAPEAMDAAQARHNDLIASLAKAHGGVIRDYAGDGVFALFEGGNPLLCAYEFQRAVQAADWGGVGGLQVRVGIHSGRGALQRPDRLSVNRAARIAQSAWGGQIVFSEATASASALPDGAQIEDLGRYRLRGIEEPMRLFGLTHPALERNSFPPLRATPASKPVLAPLTPMFGREQDIETVLGWLAGGRRTLSLVGLGGNGKTRLALEVGARLSDSVPAHVVVLRDAATAGELTTAIAAALRFPLSGQEAPEAQLLRYLRSRSLLLIFDNADRLAGRARLLGDLLGECPDVRVLVTSREPLGFPGEHVHRLEGLSAGDANGAVAGLAPACALFEYEAQLANPSFRLSPSTLEAVRDICRALAGSPLAIHLVAQWMRLLPVADVRARLADGHSLADALAATEGTTLQRVFEGSWELLSADEQETLLRLSVFEGSFDRRAAETVAEADLPVLGALERKCLLEGRAGGRLALHPLVHAHARRKRAQTDLAALKRTQARHADFYLALVRDCARAARGTAQPRMLDRIQTEAAEIGAAWRDAVARGDCGALRQTAEALFYAYAQRSLFGEAQSLMSLATGDASTDAYLASLRANCLVHQGAFEEAEALAADLLEAPSTSGLARAHCLHALANSAHARGDLATARLHYDQALAERRSLDDALGCYYSAISLGWLELQRRDLESAARFIRESYVLCLRLGHLGGMLPVHAFAGDLAQERGSPEDAKESYLLALEVEEVARNPQHRASTLVKLGKLYAESGDLAAAISRLEEAAQHASAIGDRRLETAAGLALGAALRHAGRLGPARLELDSALARARELSLDEQICAALIELGQLSLITGDRPLGARIAAVLRSPRVQGAQAARAALLADLPQDQFELDGQAWDDALLEIVNASTFGLLRL